MYAEPLINSDALDRITSYDEIDISLKRLKNGKAPGEDRIPPEFYKKAPLEFKDICIYSRMYVFFNRTYDECTSPESFNKSIIFPLHKKATPRILITIEPYRSQIPFIKYL